MGCTWVAAVAGAMWRARAIGRSLTAGRLHWAFTPGTRRGHTEPLHLNDHHETHDVLIMHEHAQPGQTAPAEAFFPTDPSGLPEATRPELLELADGDAFHLRIGPVAK